MFRAWGRVGSTVGGTKLEAFSSRADAVRGALTRALTRGLYEALDEGGALTRAGQGRGLDEGGALTWAGP